MTGHCCENYARLSEETEGAKQVTLGHNDDTAGDTSPPSSQSGKHLFHPLVEGTVALYLMK